MTNKCPSITIKCVTIHLVFFTVVCLLVLVNSFALRRKWWPTVAMVEEIKTLLVLVEGCSAFHFWLLLRFQCSAEVHEHIPHVMLLQCLHQQRTTQLRLWLAFSAISSAHIIQLNPRHQMQIKLLRHLLIGCWINSFLNCSLFVNLLGIAGMGFGELGWDLFSNCGFIFIGIDYGDGS